jgi:hypothetical protein
MEAVLTRTLLNVPEALEEVGLVALVVAVIVVLHAVVQRRLRTEILQRHNDVTGYVFSAVGILYAVLLGFVVVVVWQKYDTTTDNVQDEANAAADLYHVADGLPAATRGAVRGDLRQYARLLINVEWPVMANNGDVADTGAKILDDASYRIDLVEPANTRASNAQQASMGDVARIMDARRQRLIHSAPAVPSLLWFALIAGALAMVAFCFTFGVENRPAQLLMTAILVGLIGILFVVIYEFAGPFSGSVTISSDGWLSFTQRFGEIR